MGTSRRAESLCVCVSWMEGMDGVIDGRGMMRDRTTEERYVSRSTCWMGRREWEERWWNPHHRRSFPAFLSLLCMDGAMSRASHCLAQWLPPGRGEDARCMLGIPEGGEGE